MNKKGPGRGAHEKAQVAIRVSFIYSSASGAEQTHYARPAAGWAGWADSAVFARSLRAVHQEERNAAAVAAAAAVRLFVPAEEARITARRQCQ